MSEGTHRKDATITVNAGAVTLKLAAVDTAGSITASAHRDPWDPADREPFDEITAAVDPPIARVAHRVVHGGGRFCEPVVIDDEVSDWIDDVTDLAPLHHPRISAAIGHARATWSDACHVAVFDTAFHQTISAATSTYAIPSEWTRRWGVRRFGFHGLSHQYVARRAPEIAHDETSESIRRVISCHLGSGVSVCAIVDGASVDTTMGFTPLEGPPMATRSGSLDPGLITWLLKSGRVSVDELDDALRTRSGLAGVSGTSGDMREVLDGVDGGDRASLLALDIYVHRLAQSIASMSASAGGIDVLAFTGGVAEHLPRVRRCVADRLAFLGVRLEHDANDAAVACDAMISAGDSHVAVVVVANGEHLELVHAANRV